MPARDMVFKCVDQALATGDAYGFCNSSQLLATRIRQQSLRTFGVPNCSSLTLAQFNEKLRFLVKIEEAKEHS